MTAAMPAARAARGLRHACARGFTLIEVLVVVVLIGILATFAVMSIGNRAAEDRLESEMQRVQAILQLAADEAQMQGVDIGLRFSVTGFGFVRVNDQHHWAPYAESGPLRARQWPDAMAVDLYVDGHPVAPSPDVAAAVTAPANTTNAAQQTDDPAKDPLRPQVMLLSSGEMTAFAMDLKAAGVPYYYHFEGDLLGRLTVDRRNFQR